MKEIERPPGRVVGEGALFGFPASASVFASKDAEVYVLDAAVLTNLLTDPDVCAELDRPVLESPRSRQIDGLLRYMFRESGVFTRRILRDTEPVTHKQPVASLASPLDIFDLKGNFHDYLAACMEHLTELDPPISTVSAGSSALRLFEVNQKNSRLFVVSTGSVAITLPSTSGEPVILVEGEHFGESSLLGLPTTGAASLQPNSTVLSVDAPWFLKATQSRAPFPGVELPELPSMRPVQLLYHLAAVGYRRVQDRLVVAARRRSPQYSAARVPMPGAVRPTSTPLRRLG